MARRKLFVTARQRFGRGVVIEETRLLPTEADIRAGFYSGKRAALLQCDCGKEYTASLTNLFGGQVQSCGCVLREHGREAIRAAQDANLIHGCAPANSHWKTLYVRWRHMMERCHDPSDKKYKDYGARGIRVCDDWHAVANFVGYVKQGILVEPPYNGSAKSALPPPGYSLDRINNDGNYEPGNVRWANAAVQLANRRPRSQSSATNGSDS